MSLSSITGIVCHTSDTLSYIFVVDEANWIDKRMNAGKARTRQNHSFVVYR